MLSGIAAWLFSLSRRNKLNLNSRRVVIFVLRLAKPLRENNQRFFSAKVKVMQYIVTKSLRDGSPGSCDEHRIASGGCKPLDNPIDLRCESISEMPSLPFPAGNSRIWTSTTAFHMAGPISHFHLLLTACPAATATCTLVKPLSCC